MIDVGPGPPGEMLCSDLESSTSSRMEKLIGWAIDLGPFGCEGGTGSWAGKVLLISALICSDIRSGLWVPHSGLQIPGFARE